jgi:hypothetical protein
LLNCAVFGALLNISLVVKGNAEVVLDSSEPLVSHLNLASAKRVDLVLYKLGGPGIYLLVKHCSLNHSSITID